MKISEVMSAPAVVLPAHAAIRDVARHMDYNGVGCVALSDGRRLAGIVTDRDLALRALALDVGGESPVSEVMTSDPVTVGPDDDLTVAFEVFRRNSFRRLPVLDEDVVVGMLTVDDLLLHVHRLTSGLLMPVAREIGEQ